MNHYQLAASNHLLSTCVFTWLLRVKLLDVSHVLAQGTLEVPLGQMGAEDVTAAQHDGRGEHYHPPARSGKINCNCRTRKGRRWVRVKDSQSSCGTKCSMAALRQRSQGFSSAQKQTQQQTKRQDIVDVDECFQRGLLYIGRYYDGICFPTGNYDVLLALLVCVVSGAKLTAF